MRTRGEFSRFINTRKAVVGGSKISKAYYKKAVEYGSYLDVYEYAQVKITWKQERIDYQKKDTGTKLDRSLRRAKDNIFKIAEANAKAHGDFEPVFFTLTFAENITDLQEANAHFKYFCTKLRNYIGRRVHYIVVPEFQKRGAVHYHGIFFNLPYVDVPTFKELWGQGYIDLQVTRNLRSCGAYIAKYITKSILDSRLFGQKLYSTSRGLLRPIHIFDESVLEMLERRDNMEVLQAFAGSDYIKIKYKKI